MALKVLQANINHCTTAQDMLMQYRAEWGANIAVVSEPYWVPDGRQDWVADQKGLVVIIVSGGLQLEMKARGDGFVVAKCGEILLAGVYCPPPPNGTVTSLEACLDRLGIILQRLTLPTLVCGDFNAKSTAWGSPATDVRGEVVLEWATALGLAVLNRGTVPTCVRPQGRSRVDLTLASLEIAVRTSGWTVRAEAESMSDHRYITFDISASNNHAPPRPLRCFLGGA